MTIRMGHDVFPRSEVLRELLSSPEGSGLVREYFMKQTNLDGVRRKRYDDERLVSRAIELMQAGRTKYQAALQACEEEENLRGNSLDGCRRRTVRELDDRARRLP